LFCKPAREGGVVAWHQDYSYWTRTQPMAHLTCWIGLDQSTLENGCLQYVPESHRWPLLPVTGLAGDMDEIRTVLTAQQQWRVASGDGAAGARGGSLPPSADGARQLPEPLATGTPGGRW
jgi:ectoine hydroxylase-related dioxygenase (phytanoyl-CoA dioxygenase family)